MVRIGTVSVGCCGDCDKFHFKGLHKSGPTTRMAWSDDSAFVAVVQCSRETGGITDKSTFGSWYHLYLSEYSGSSQLLYLKNSENLPGTDQSNIKLHPLHFYENLEIVAARNSKIQTHAAVTNIVPILQYSEMWHASAKVGNLKEMLHLQAMTIYKP